MHQRVGSRVQTSLKLPLRGPPRTRGHSRRPPPILPSSLPEYGPLIAIRVGVALGQSSESAAYLSSTTRLEPPSDRRTAQDKSYKPPCCPLTMMGRRSNYTAGLTSYTSAPAPRGASTTRLEPPSHRQTAQDKSYKPLCCPLIMMGLRSKYPSAPAAPCTPRGAD